MEFNSDSRSFCLPVTVLDTVAEQLADVDLTLPDYCPDIEKILKCTLVPQIQTKSLSGGQLQIEGSCSVGVLYVESEHKTIRCCEQSVNFSQSFSVRDTSDNFAVITKTKPEYINCRALSPRRLVIHGAFSLYVKVLTTQKTTLFTPADGSLELLTKKMDFADLTAFCQEQFTVSEEISVADKPRIEGILYSKVTAAVTDVKAVTGKLMVSGELNLKLFYLTDVESGETAKLDYILPFSRIADCEGIDENTRNLLGCDVMSYDIRLKNDMLSDKPAVALDAKLCLTAEGYEIENKELIIDAYSTEFASVPQFEKLKSIGEVNPVSESYIEKLTASLDDGKISKILDIYSDSVTTDSKPSKDAVEVSGKINLCIVALDDKNYPIFIERSCDYSHVPDSTQGCNAMYFLRAEPSGISFRLSDDSSAEIRCELKITGGAVKNEVTKAVSGVEVLEDKPVKPENCSLMLYYAAQGENLWEIAKAHNTALDSLLKENQVEELTLDSPQMLLIPKA